MLAIVPDNPETVMFEGYGEAGLGVPVASLIVIGAGLVNPGGVCPGVGVVVAVGVTAGVVVGVAAGVGVAVGSGVELPVVIISEYPPDITPESPVNESMTYKLHKPFGFIPPNVLFNVAVPVGAGWL